MQYQWWKSEEYAKYNIDRNQDFWLPPDEYVDPEKLKPKRLTPDEYDEMHTALTSINKMIGSLNPQQINGLIGAVEISVPNKDLFGPNSGKALTPPIYRTYSGGDRWACHDCKDRGDKWYMQDHACSRSKVVKLAWLRVKQGQRKVERIKKLQGENQRIA